MATFTVCILYAIETEEKKEYAVAENDLGWERIKIISELEGMKWALSTQE